MPKGYPGRECGTYSGYNGGCRCEACRQAASEYYVVRARAMGVGPARRGRTCGLISAYHHGCRCEDCRRAARETKRRQRAQKASANA